jgi:hypothetical protein
LLEFASLGLKIALTLERSLGVEPDLDDEVERFEGVHPTFAKIPSD